MREDVKTRDGLSYTDRISIRTIALEHAKQLSGMKDTKTLLADARAIEEFLLTEPGKNLN